MGAGQAYPEHVVVRWPSAWRLCTCLGMEVNHEPDICGLNTNVSLGVQLGAWNLLVSRRPSIGSCANVCAGATAGGGGWPLPLREAGTKLHSCKRVASVNQNPQHRPLSLTLSLCPRLHTRRSTHQASPSHSPTPSNCTCACLRGVKQYLACFCDSFLCFVQCVPCVSRPKALSC